MAAIKETVMSVRTISVVLLMISILIISGIWPARLLAAITSMDNLWAPYLNNEKDVEILKKDIEKYLSEMDLDKFVGLLLEKKYETLDVSLEMISLAKYLRQFFLGYGEEGKMTQYLELIDDTFLVKWPVPIARSKELGRRLKEELKFAKNEVDRIFKDDVGIEHYNGIIPIWIAYTDNRANTDSPQTAGITIGGALILLFIPGAPTNADRNTWHLSSDEIESLMETAKHELIHFYVNRRLDYHKSQKLPRDFHEGLATSLINESIYKIAKVETVFTDVNSYVRTTKIIEAPEEYKRYHLQMKYLRQFYGNTSFYTFIKKVLSGDDIDKSVKNVFGASSFGKLFPPDLSLWMVQKKIGLNTVYIFISAIIGVMGLFILWHLGMSSLRRYVIAVLLRKRSLMSEMHTVVERISKSKVRKRFLSKPRNIIIIVSVILGALIVDLYRKWALTLNIDIPPNMFLALTYFDSIIGVGIVISAVAIFPLNFLFLKKLEKEAAQLGNSISQLSTAESVAGFNRTLLFNSALLRLGRLESTLKFFPAFNRIINSGNKIKSILEEFTVKKILQEINSLISQGSFENAYKMYVNYRCKIEENLSDAYKAELNKIIESIVEYIFKGATSYVDAGQIDEAQELMQLLSLIIQEEGLNSENERLLKLQSQILTKRAIQEEFRIDDYGNLVENLFNLALFLRDMGEHDSAGLLYHRLIEIYESIIGHGTVIPLQVLSMVATCHNEIAFHIEVPTKNWKKAEFHYRKAIEIFNRIPDSVQTVNSELNLQTIFHLSGQKVDVEKIIELTQILEEAGDTRAEKGYRLLKELS